ncbi:MAG TPA: aconitase/3-isopropylmalate dehydratase large subunit family protein [Gemmatimonadaceae bacterium]|nr:aconitase/3-isopropylmalate dehydratase large subunit family protein [Gemmatimonadaceae bacterium]
MSAGGRTISEKILSAKANRDARAGDVVTCTPDLILGTDASTPMAIDYFGRMGGTSVRDASHVMFACDHYAPPTSDRTRAFHALMRAFAKQHGIMMHEVGDGISFQIATEQGRALPGHLVIGADSHTVTCGALGLFATGVGSSDLAAALVTGTVWLRVPETIRVTLTGALRPGVMAKDLALHLVGMVGADGANYQTLEFHGPGVRTLSLDDRLVVCNLGVEMDAKASIFPFDATTEEYLAPRTRERGTSVMSDDDAAFAREILIDLSAVTPRIARPHAPDNVTPLASAIGTAVQMVFIGTCTGGRISDLHAALAVLESLGGKVAPGVQLVVTPASREVAERARADGTLDGLQRAGAIITETGCGACCGTSGVIPGNGATVVSTANRNFKARMGNATASIYLASPAACAAAAATGRIVEVA